LRRAVLPYVVIFIAVSAWSPYLVLYYKSLGISYGQIGALSAFTSCVGMFAAPAWGALHDRYPRSLVLLPLAGLIGGLGGYGMATVGASPLLIPSVALFAIGVGGLTPMMDVRVLELAGSDRSRYGRVRACGSASFMVGAPIVGLLKDNQGPASIFWVIIPAMVIGSLIAIAVPGRTKVVRTVSMFRAPGRVLQHRPIALLLIGYLTCFAAISSQSSYIGVYLRDLGASNELVGWAASIGAVLEIPIMFFFPRLARRFGVERLILLGAFIVAVRQIANVTFTDPHVLVGCAILQGAGYALLIVGGVTFISRQAPKGTAATAQGLFNAAAFSLAAIIGSGGGGQLASLLGIRGMYGVSVMVGFIGFAAIAVAVLPFIGSRESEKLPPALEPDAPPV
jgi:MFS transporter, PPP family, 3-phenylpropionic acid transporter